METKDWRLRREAVHTGRGVSTGLTGRDIASEDLQEDAQDVGVEDLEGGINSFMHSLIALVAAAGNEYVFNFKVSCKMSCKKASSGSSGMSLSGSPWLPNSWSDSPSEMLRV